MTPVEPDHEPAAPERRAVGDPWRELRSTLGSLTHAVTSVAGRDTARELVAPLRRQAELFAELIDAERRLQREVVGRALSPLDAVFDLLEESGEAMRGQAEAVEHAAEALEQTATLMRTQAELFERTVHTLREPTRLLASAAGVERADP